MDRAGAGGVFQQGALRVFGRQRQVILNRQAGDAARGVLGHFLEYFHADPIEFQSMPPRRNGHEGEHTGTESGGGKIGRAEISAFAVIVHRRIGFQNGPGGAVHRATAEAARIRNFDFNHMRMIEAHRGVQCNAVHLRFVQSVARHSAAVFAIAFAQHQISDVAQIGDGRARWCGRELPCLSHGVVRSLRR